MKTEILINAGLGSGDSGTDVLTHGWSRPEPHGTWTIGTVSRVALGTLATGFDHMVALTARPFINPPAVSRQTIRANLGGIAIGEVPIDGPTTLGFLIPAALVACDAPAILTLHHRFAARPCDSLDSPDDRPIAVQYERLRLYRMARHAGWAAAMHAQAPFDAPIRAANPGVAAAPDPGLAQSVERELGLPIAELLKRFESVGDNCEFGLVQRRCGAEPLGLLRFSSTPLRRLLQGLDNGFAGLGDADAIEPQLHGTRPPREYMIREHNYDLVYHTFHHEDQMGIGTVRKQEALRLSFLRRKFLGDLELGAKIIVCKRQPMLTEAEVLPLLAALGEHGPNTLLWASEANGTHEPGSVEVVADRLIKGYIDRFAPGENAHDLSLNCWLQLCANAYAIWPERHLADLGRASA